MTFKKWILIFITATLTLGLALGIANVFRDNSIKWFNYDINNPRVAKTEYSINVPILEYHQIDNDEKKPNEYTITSKKFRSDLQVLKNNGYITIAFNDLLDYVNERKNLPTKSVIITFDDGYENVYKYAYPILKEFNMKATLAVIGISVGKSTYKGTDLPIIPHFSYAEAKEMYMSNLIDIQSHSYNMHDNKDLQDRIKTDYRDGVLQKKIESKSDYIASFRKDYLKSKEEIEKNIGNNVFVFIYPGGKYSTLSEALLKEMGNKITVSTIQGVSQIRKGVPQSLHKLKRINVSSDLKGEDLIKRMNFFTK